MTRSSLTRPSAGREPSRRGAARREELFDELVALLLREGFAELTLDNVAARLRCSKRTLYGLARSKEQLVRAAVVHFFKRVTSAVDAEVVGGAGPAERLVAYFGAVARQLEGVSVEFFDDVATFPPAAEVYEQNIRAAVRRIEKLIDEGVQTGEFRSVHVPLAADVIASTMVRIQERRVVATTGLADSVAYEALASLLLHGLLRDSTDDDE